MKKSGRKPRRYWRLSDEQMLEEVRYVAGLVESSFLTSTEFTKRSRISLGAVCKRFGCWGNVLAAAGVSHMYSGSKGSEFRRTDDELLQELCRAAQLVGKPILTSGEFRKISGISIDCIRKRLGSWKAALERAGIGEMHSGKIPSPRPVDYYPDKALLAEVRRVSLLVRKPILTRKDFKSLSGIDPGTLSRRFGDWRDVLKRAGVPNMYSGREISDLKRSSRRFSSDAEIIDLIRDAAAKSGKDPLTASECARLTGLGRSTIEKRFGDWKRAMEAAGLSTDGLGKHYTDEDCLKNLAVAWKHHGRPPLKGEMDISPSWIGSHVYAKRWGSWPEVLEVFLQWADGGQSEEQPPMDRDRPFESWRGAFDATRVREGPFVRLYTDEELFQNMADEWRRHEKRPSAKSLHGPTSKISGGAYQTRWGTLNKAVEAFVLWADANSLTPPADGVIRFPSWSSALAASQRPSPKRYTKEECLQNLADVWKYYGRQPTSTLLNRPPSKAPCSAYYYRWGTWPKSIEAFLEWAGETGVLEEKGR